MIEEKAGRQFQDDMTPARANQIRAERIQGKSPSVNNLKTEDLNPEQLANLMEVIDQEPDLMAPNFMKLALFTGMRRGELFKLRWEEIDFDRGFIHIRRPKGGKDQKILMNPAARNERESSQDCQRGGIIYGNRCY